VPSASIRPDSASSRCDSDAEDDVYSVRRPTRILVASGAMRQLVDLPDATSITKML